MLSVAVTTAADTMVTRLPQIAVGNGHILGK
jgi:hypothetical protein